MKKEKKEEIKSFKELVSVLQQFIDTFSSPIEKLEQYQTEPQVAGEIALYLKNKYRDDLIDLKIADLGCGTGILGIALALYGCEDVTLFDIDENAIDIAKENVSALNLEDKIQFVLIDVREMQNLKSFRKKFDLIITNPPFGIRSSKGYDVEFIKTGINICKGEMLSLHKFDTKDFLKKFYAKQDIKDVQAFQIEYDLPKSYKFHKKDNKKIKVVCIEAQINDILYKAED